jgi:hypothetical protein
MTTFATCARGAVVASALILAACGTTPGERAVTGGMLGAAGGAAIGAATGSAATGAAIGGVAGAAAGALTDPCDLDLGTPFWKHHGGRRGYERRCGHPPPYDD